MSFNFMAAVTICSDFGLWYFVYGRFAVSIEFKKYENSSFVLFKIILAIWGNSRQSLKPKFRLPPS